MAEFNPQIRDTQDPNYLRWSRPIENFDLKSTVGMGIKAVGDTLDSAIKGADQVVKSFAKQDTQDTVVPFRDEYIAGLSLNKEAIYGKGTPTSIIAGVPAGGDNQPKDPSLVPQGPELPMPEDLKNLPGKLSTLNGARANGNLSETDYYGRLIALTKDIRSRYPAGYRDYIDQEVQKITGVDPANAYIKSIIGDINSAKSSKNEAKKDARELLQKYPVQGWNVALAKLDSDEWTPQDVMNFLAKPMSLQFDRSQKEADLKLKVQQRTAVKEDWETNANDLGNSLTQEYLHSIKYLPGVRTMQDLNDILIKHYQGRGPELEPEQWTQLERLARGWEQSYRADMQKRYSAVDENGNSYVKILGQNKVNSLINDGAKPFSDIADAYGKKDVGVAYESIKDAEVILGKEKYKAFTDPDLGNFNRKSTIYQGILGKDMYEKLVQRIITTPKINAAWDTKAKEIEMDLTLPPDARFNKTVFTFKEAFEEVAKREKTLGRAPSVYEGIAGLMDRKDGSFVDEKVPIEVKKQLATAFFGPGNENSLWNIKEDVRLPNGDMVPGRESLYYRFTRPDIVKTINSLGDPVIKEHYENWVKTVGAKDILQRPLAELDQTPTAGKNWSVSYNAETNRFDIKSRGPRAENPYADRVFRRINKGLDGISSVARENGRDPEAAVLQAILDGGVNPDTVLKIPGITKDMITSLLVSKITAKEIKQQQELEAAQAEGRKQQFKAPE